MKLYRQVLQANTHIGGFGIKVVVTGKADFFCNVACQVLRQCSSNEGIDYTLAGGGPG